MLPIAYLVKVAIPDYLAGLPIPDTFGGWFRLGSKYVVSNEWTFHHFILLLKGIIIYDLNKLINPCKHCSFWIIVLLS